MSTKPFVYMVTSLSGDTPSNERDFIRGVVNYLGDNVNLLPWCFDLEKWEPIPVINVADYDMTQIMFADFVVGVYNSSLGCDGRGALLCHQSIIDPEKRVRIYARNGIRISRFMNDLFLNRKIPMRIFGTVINDAYTVRELGEMVIMDTKQRTSKLTNPGNHRRNAQRQLADPKSNFYCKVATEKMMALQS